jgi:hypothetical protein
MSTGGYRYMSSDISPAPAVATTSAVDTVSADDDVWGKSYPVDPDFNWGCPFDIRDEVLSEAYSPVRVEYVPDAPPKVPAKRSRKPVKRYGFE